MSNLVIVTTQKHTSEQVESEIRCYVHALKDIQLG